MANVLVSYTDVLSKKDATRLKKLEKLILQYGYISKIPTKNLKALGWSDYSGARKWKIRKDNVLEEFINDNGTSAKIRGTHKKHSGNSRNTSKNKSTNHNNLERLPKYGKLAPTNHISPLSNTDWVKKYIEHDYDVDLDNPEELEAIKAQWDLAYEDYLTEVLEFLWTTQEGGALLPRGTGKTESVVALFVRYFLEQRKALYIVTPSTSHSRMILYRIIRTLEGHKIRRQYGDVMKEYSTDRTMMYINYHDDIGWIRFDFPISIATYASAKEGVHCDWLHFEDCMQKEAKNIETIQDVEYKHNKTFEKMRTRRGKQRTRMTFTGTRYSTEDYYHFLITTRKYEVLHIPALHEDNKTMIKCPNYTIEDLLKDKELDLWSFETSMNNNPLPRDGLYYDKDAWKIVPDLPFKEMVQGNCYIAYDPAFGMSSSADFACMIVGVVHDNKLKIVKIELKKGLSFKQQIDRLRWYSNTYHPRVLEVEAVMHQQWLAVEASSYIRSLVANDRRQSKQSKIQRLDALDLPFRQGLIEICEGAGDIDEAYKQYISYNRTDSTKSRKDDFLDALEMLYERTKHYLSSQRLYIKSWN